MFAENVWPYKIQQIKWVELLKLGEKLQKKTLKLKKTSKNRVIGGIIIIKKKQRKKMRKQFSFEDEQNNK